MKHPDDQKFSALRQLLQRAPVTQAALERRLAARVRAFNRPFHDRIGLSPGHLFGHSSRPLASINGGAQ